MKISIETTLHAHDPNVNIRCPHCGHNGTFQELIHTGVVSKNHPYILGIKICPNQTCRGQLFYIMDLQTNSLLETFPKEVIEFDKENIPEKILKAFEESVICHSNNCFIASAIMIRKTLEEICFERGANGNNLKQKIIELGNKIMIPKELLQGVDELRILGNDAAHIEAKEYSEIGVDEIELSIDFTKEVLKAVYQYENLLEKFRKLKEKKNA